MAKDIVSPQGGSPRTNKTIEFDQAAEARVPELTIYIEDILRSEDYIKLKNSSKATNYYKQIGRASCRERVLMPV